MPVDTAVQPVGSNAVDTLQTAAGAAPIHDFSMLSMFLGADFIVKSVILLLLFSSFWSWAIIFEKWMRFKGAKAKASRFENDFWSSDALDKFHEKTKKKAAHPMATVFLTAMEEWFRSRVKDFPNTAPTLRSGVRERVGHLMQVARNRELDRLESGLGFLATVGSTAPFIGLFGTVWGIMNSFSSIAASKNTSLAVVAPGIAEALFATAIGLFAAIPAVVAYNKFSGELDKFAGRMEDFCTEFNTLLSRQIDGGM